MTTRWIAAIMITLTAALGMGAVDTSKGVPVRAQQWLGGTTQTTKMRWDGTSSTLALLGGTIKGFSGASEVAPTVTIDPLTGDIASTTMHAGGQAVVINNDSRLHSQNTDSGTNAQTFVISDGQNYPYPGVSIWSDGAASHKGIAHINDGSLYAWDFDDVIPADFYAANFHALGGSVESGVGTFGDLSATTAVVSGHAVVTTDDSRLALAHNQNQDHELLGGDDNPDIDITANSSASAPPGNVNITAGSVLGVDPYHNGGDVNITPGTSSGEYAAGQIKLNGGTVIDGALQAESAQVGGQSVVTTDDGRLAQAHAQNGDNGTIHATFTVNSSMAAENYPGIVINQQTGGIVKGLTVKTDGELYAWDFDSDIPANFNTARCAVSTGNYITEQSGGMGYFAANDTHYFDGNVHCMSAGPFTISNAAGNIDIHPKASANVYAGSVTANGVDCAGTSIGMNAALSGAITNLYGLRINAPTKTGSTPSVAASLYLESPTIGTTNYALITPGNMRISTDGSASGGQFYFGTTAPSSWSASAAGWLVATSGKGLWGGVAPYTTGKFTLDWSGTPTIGPVNTDLIIASRPTITGNTTFAGTATAQTTLTANLINASSVIAGNTSVQGALTMTTGTATVAQVAATTVTAGALAINGDGYYGEAMIAAGQTSVTVYTSHILLSDVIVVSCPEATGVLTGAPWTEAVIEHAQFVIRTPNAVSEDAYINWRIIK